MTIWAGRPATTSEKCGLLHSYSHSSIIALLYPGIIIIFQGDIQDLDSYEIVKNVKDPAGIAATMSNRQ